MAKMHIAGLILAIGAGIAAAELQNVEVGGKIEMYGLYYTDFYDAADGARTPAAFLKGRAIGPNGTFSLYRADEHAIGSAYVEQRTRLHVNADFTDEVSAFIEFDSIDTWGEDFRSVNYVTGADTRANSADDVELFQAYIQAEQLYGLPLMLRLGRQALDFGSGWLVGSDPGPNPYTGVSFDALRLTYAQDPFTVDVWASKISEAMRGFNENDIDFYGFYASYSIPSGEENAESALVQWDLYWMLLRDDQPIESTTLSLTGEWIEDLLGRDQYGSTNLHTVGTRVAGEWASFDYEAEAAYQWGAANSVGALYIPVGGLYGDEDAKWTNWGGHLEVGYTFDIKYSPRIALGGVYYGGHDKRDISLAQWLNPFHSPEASVSFNRLFTSYREDYMMDISGLSNFWKAYLAITASPTESVELGCDLYYMQTLQAFDQPLNRIIGGRRVPFFSMLPFCTETGSKDLGWQVALWASYAYSENLSFEAGWAHFFLGDAFADGVYLDDYAHSMVDGLGTEGVDFFYWQATIEF